MSHENSCIKPCTVCGKLFDSVPVLRKEDDGRGSGAISLYRCTFCKTVYLGEYNEDYVDDLYSYYEKYIGLPKHEVYNELTYKSYMNVLKFISSNTYGNCILDVGCGKGDFVDAAYSKGFDVMGIELSQKAVDVAAQFNLPVKYLDFFSDSIEKSSRDIITMFEVIEHLPDPQGFFRRAQDVVRPGGLIYITTPNYSSLDRKVLGSRWKAIHCEHLTYFTPTSLLNAIRKNTDLEVLHAETRNLSAELLQYLINFRRIDRSERFCDRKESLKVIDGSNVRSTIDKSSTLSILKRFANVTLNLTQSGSTIVMLLRRPI